MEEIVFLVVVFFVDVLPFISKALGGFLLMSPESIKIRNSIYSFLPFFAYVRSKFFFAGIKEILMDLEKVFFEFFCENSWDPIDNWIP